MTLITATEMLDELHIDQSDEEQKVVQRLITDASVLIRGSISDDVTGDQILEIAGDVYNRLIISLVTRMYYDRELSNGYGMGIQIMLNQLRARVLGAEDGQQVKTV